MTCSFSSTFYCFYVEKGPSFRPHFLSYNSIMGLALIGFQLIWITNAISMTRLAASKSFIGKRIIRTKYWASVSLLYNGSTFYPVQQQIHESPLTAASFICSKFFQSSWKTNLIVIVSVPLNEPPLPASGNSQTEVIDPPCRTPTWPQHDFTFQFSQDHIRYIEL